MTSKIKQSLSPTTERLDHFLAGNIPLLFIFTNQPKSRSILNNLIPNQPHFKKKLECDGTSLISTQALLNHLYQHISLTKPKQKLKVTQQLKYIYSETLQKKIRFHFFIHDAQNIPISVLAALSHLMLLQEDNPTIPTIITANQKLIEQTAQLGLKRYLCINIDKIKLKSQPLKKNRTTSTVTNIIKLQQQKLPKWLLKPQFIAATLTTCIVSTSLISKYEKHHIKKRNYSFHPVARTVSHRPRNTIKLIKGHKRLQLTQAHTVIKKTTSTAG